MTGPESEGGPRLLVMDDRLMMPLMNFVPLGQMSIRDRVFEDLVLVGPAVMFDRELNYSQCTIAHDDFQTLVWETPGSEPKNGCVQLINCTFTRCHFMGIGFAGDHDMITRFALAMLPPAGP